MALDFPSNPVNGQVYGNYYYDSSMTAWRAFGVSNYPNPLVNATITTSSATGVPSTIQGYASQSANLEEWKNSSGTVLSSMSSSGALSTQSLSLITPLALTSGGTGSTSASGALSSIGAAAASHVHAATDITSGSLAIARGGTGATTGTGLVSIIPTSTTIFNGAGSASVNANGLVTFTNVNSFAINGIYSTSYDYVLVKFVQWNGPGNYLYARLASSGSYTTVAAYYGTAYYKQGAGMGNWDDYAARAYVSVGYLPPSENSGCDIFVYNGLNSAGVGNPILKFDSYYMGGNGTTVNGVAKWNGTPVFDGLNLYSSAGNLFSGTAQVYGFRKS